MKITLKNVFLAMFVIVLLLIAMTASVQTTLTQTGLFPTFNFRVEF